MVNHVVHLMRHGEDILQVFTAELFDRENILAIPGRVLVVAEGQVGQIVFVEHELLLILE
jgi:hypothetical protein